MAATIEANWDRFAALSLPSPASPRASHCSQGARNVSISRECAAGSRRPRTCLSSTTTSVGSVVDAEALDEVGPLLAGDPVERNVSWLRRRCSTCAR